MTDKTQPEALRLANNIHCGDSACKCSLNLAASELRRQHARITELEAQLEAVGAGWVQALSAAPAGWKLVPVEPTNDMQKAADEWAAKGFDWPKAVYRAMLAASPTPPAEQQAAKETSGGFHVWRDISTAPKDGSRFVATGHNYGLYSEVRHTCVAQWFRGCWMEASDWNETSELKYLTHWMPLPSPPDDVAAPAEQPATTEAATPKGAATTGAPLGGVYAELPAPNLPRGGFPDLFTEGQMRDFADRTHSSRLRCKSEQARLATLWGYVRADATTKQAAPKAAPVVWLSSKQLRGVTALHGQYLPFRCQPEGRFDTPVYLVEAAPKAAPGEPVHGDVLPPVGSRVYIRHGRDNDAHACTVTGYYAWGDLGGDKRLHRVFVRLVYEGTDRQQARMLCDCYPTAEAALAQAAPQQEVSQDTMYLLRRLLSNQHTLTGSEFRAELEKIVGEAYQQEAQEPVFCSYCGGNDETPQEHCTDCLRPVPAKARIREIFLANGFTIKEGQADLKQYVYDAAYALLSEAPQPAPAPLSDDVVKDAARYRWLRTNAIGAFRTNNGNGPVSVYHLSKIPALPGIQEETDAAIDDALAAQGGTP